MKRVLYFVLIFAASVAFAGKQPSDPSTKLVGAYLWMVPGSTWTLTLRSTGEYDLTTRGCFDESVEPVESGRWVYEGFSVILSSKKAPCSGDSDYRQLYVLKDGSGRLVLVSSLLNAGRPDSLPFRYSFIWSEDGLSLPASALGEEEPPQERKPNKPLHGTPAKAPSSSAEPEGRRP